MNSSKYFSSTENTMLSQLSGDKILDLLVEVENYDLDYRSNLGLPDDLTFGIEIEYEDLPKEKVDKFIDRKGYNWKSKTDVTVSSGGELNSPVMRDNSKAWNEIEDVCNMLTSKGANTSDHAGGHIHIGANILGEDVDAWKTFLKLYACYEHVLNRFTFGDKINARTTFMHYAEPVADIIRDRIDKINNATSRFSFYNIVGIDRRVRPCLNLSNTTYYRYDEHEKHTIEFRGPNGTSNATIWQNNINTVAKMLIASKSGVINTDFLDNKLKNSKKASDNKYIYDTVNIKDSLEFCDLVFDNNLDKVYFLRQYYKDFDEVFTASSAIDAKKFVK